MSVRLRGVSLAYARGATAINGLDLTIAAGERVAIIGPSGAGKTTLLHLLTAGLRPDSGTLELFGSDPWLLPASTLRTLRARIGLIHQAPPLPPRQRVVTAVAAGRLGQWPLPKSLLNLVYPLDAAGIRTVLERLDLGDKLFLRCDQLSGGQLQRVGIARVLYQEPDIILADEPVAAVDPRLADHTVGLLNREAALRGVTLVASLHSVELALSHFSRVIGLRDGRIAFDRPAEQVAADALRALYANEQLQSPPAAAPGCVRVPLC